MDIAKTDINLKIVQIVPFNPSSNFLLRTEVTIVNPKVGAGDRGGLLACHGHSQELEVTWWQFGGVGLEGIGDAKSGSVISFE